jgi:hypothetical protein
MVSFHFGPLFKVTASNKKAIKTEEEAIPKARGD